MRRRDVSLTIAVCVSLLAHGGLAVWAADAYRREQLARLIGFGRLVRGHPPGGEIRPTNELQLPTYYLPPSEPDRQRDVLKEPEPRPLRVPLRPPPPRAVPDDPTAGDAIGGGEAAARSTGERLMQALDNSQTQAALSKNPGLAGAIGQNGSGAASPAAPRLAPQPPAPKPAPPQSPQDQQREQRAEGQSSAGEGFLKRGGAPSAPRQDEPVAGVETKQVLPATPKVSVKPALPQVQQKPKALPGAREAEALPKSAGQQRDAKALEEKARDERQRPSEKPVDREVAGKDAPEGKAATALPPDPAVGPKPAAVKGDMQEKLRDLKAAADATSPKGDLESKESQLKEGVAASPEPGTATETMKTEAGEKLQAEVTRSDPNASKERAEKATGASAAAQASATVTPVAPVPPPLPASVAAPAQTGDGKLPGTAGGSGGDPGEQSESESDPFRKNGELTFTPGKVDAKFGRKVKWVRPRFTLAGQTDAFLRARPTISLAVSTDETGKVIKVEVLESTGAPDTVDLPIVRAVYEWWIEPPKDEQGKPRADTMVWQINLRGR